MNTQETDEKIILPVEDTIYKLDLQPSFKSAFTSTGHQRECKENSEENNSFYTAREPVIGQLELDNDSVGLSTEKDEDNSDLKLDRQSEIMARGTFGLENFSKLQDNSTRITTDQRFFRLALS